MIKLHNLTKWVLLAAGQVVQFNSTGNKLVEVNCEMPTRFDWSDGEDSKFLGVVIGMDKLAFKATEGSFLSATSEGEVWYFTNEGDQTASDRKRVSFTKMMGRRTRSTQLEKMLQLQAMNYERKLAAQAAEAQALQDALGRHDTQTGEVIEDDKISVGPVDGTTGTDATAPVAPAAEPAAPGGETPAAGTSVPA